MKVRKATLTVAPRYNPGVVPCVTQRLGSTVRGARAPLTTVGNLALRFAVLALLGVEGCASHEDEPAAAKAPVPLQVEAARALTSGEEALLAQLREEVGGGERDRQWVARVEGPSIRVPDACTLDVQAGSAHGGTLTSLRIVLAGATAHIEQIEGDGSSVTRRMPLTTSVRRAVVARQDVTALFDLCGALATVTAERRPIPGVESDGVWSMSLDVYSLVRLSDAAGKPLVEKHFVGYFGEAALTRLTPLDAATEPIHEFVSRITAWTEVPEGERRGCHLTSAFDANRTVMIGDFAWFVQERSLEMLAQVGNRDAIPTLEWLRDHDPDDSRRRKHKIAMLLADPARWLEGPAQDLASGE